MKWKIADAKANFSEIIRKAEKEPQLIYNRDRMVAVVVSKDEYEEYERIKKTVSERNIGSAFNEFSSICAEESYVFETPARKNRKVILP
jgi:prevent-host-death family protein